MEHDWTFFKLNNEWTHFKRNGQIFILKKVNCFLITSFFFSFVKPYFIGSSFYSHKNIDMQVTKYDFIF